jgi:hypothetical protein
MLLRRLAFVVVQQAVFSLYLGISFAPNHKGMPIIQSATAVGFARRQVVTARNISGGRLTPHPACLYRQVIGSDDRPCSPCVFPPGCHGG